MALVIAVLATLVGLGLVALLVLVTMDSAMHAVGWLRRHYLERFAGLSESGGPLSPFLIRGGIGLTVVGVVGGLLTDASGVLGNVLANLVLIGPAIVISDVVVASVRRAQSDQRTRQYAGLTAKFLLPSISAANDFLIVLGSEKRCEEENTIFNENDGRLDLHAIVSALDNAANVVAQEAAAFVEKAGDDVPFSLPLKSDTLSFELPHFAAVASTTATLDREIACPAVVLFATAAEYFSRDSYVDFYWKGQPALLQPPGTERTIVDPKIGFSEIRVWMMRAARGKSATGVEITIGLATYEEFVHECLRRSRSVLWWMIEELPGRLVSPPDGSPLTP